MAEPVAPSATGAAGEWIRDKAHQAKESVEQAFAMPGEGLDAAKRAAQGAVASAQDKVGQAADYSHRTASDQVRFPACWPYPALWLCPLPPAGDVPTRVRSRPLDPLRRLRRRRTWRRVRATT